MKKRCICMILMLTIMACLGCEKDTNSPRVINGIYASSGNYNFTIYKTLSTVVSIRLYLVCNDPLPQGVDVHIDMEAQYNYEIMDITPDYLTEVDYPYGLYCCERGLDYTKLQRLENTAIQAKEAWQKDPKKEDAYITAIESLNEYQNQYLEEYKNLIRQNPVPEFYHYLVDIRCVDATGSPEIHQVELVAENWSHTIEIGSVRVVEAQMPDNYSRGLHNHILAVQGSAGSAWYPQAVMIDAIDFDVNEETALTNIYFYGDSSAKVDNVELNITSESGQVITTAWKQGTPLQLRKGERVTGTISIIDEALYCAEYGSSLVLMLEFDQSGEKTFLTTSFSLFRRRNPQEVYLWAFKGADVQGYYEYLYGT